MSIIAISNDLENRKGYIYNGSDSSNTKLIRLDYLEPLSDTYDLNPTWTSTQVSMTPRTGNFAPTIQYGYVTGHFDNGEYYDVVSSWGDVTEIVNADTGWTYTVRGTIWSNGLNITPAYITITASKTLLGYGNCSANLQIWTPVS